MTGAAVKRVGVSGTGMISHCFVRLIMQHYQDLDISRVLTRRRVDTLGDFPLPDRLTNSIASSSRTRTSSSNARATCSSEPRSLSAPSKPGCRL